MAVRHDLPEAAHPVCVPSGRTWPRGTRSWWAVGSQAQAVALASEWTKDTATLTDRMWPGPLTVIVPARTVCGGHGAMPGAGGRTPHHAGHAPAARACVGESAPVGPCAPWFDPTGTPWLIRPRWRFRLTGSDVTLIVNGGLCRGAVPTVVDCTLSPPEVSRVGALPESYVDAALMMGQSTSEGFSPGGRITPPSAERTERAGPSVQGQGAIGSQCARAGRCPLRCRAGPGCRDRRCLPHALLSLPVRQATIAALRAALAVERHGVGLHPHRAEGGRIHGALREYVHFGLHVAPGPNSSCP